MRNVILVLMIASSGWSFSLIQLATGQYTVYENGDDGAYEIGMRRSLLRDASKEIVIDENTKLIWQDSAAIVGSAVTQAQAINNCNVLVHGGYSDWRLPAIEELESLIDKSKTTPPRVDTAFVHAAAKDYWSSTSYAALDNHAWFIDLYGGGEGHDKETYQKLTMCVRGAPMSAPSYTRDATNNMVADDAGMLMWQDDTDASGPDHNWSAAIGYCENLSLGGYTDWRLPSINELWGLQNRNTASPSLPDAFTNYTLRMSYWSSTTRSANSAEAWDLSMYDGNGFWRDKNATSAVRCVRGRYVHPAEPYIERFFQSFYNDIADRDDFYQWYEVMKQQSAASVAIAFFNSTEFENMNLTDAQYLDLLYYTVMGRVLDEAEKDALLARLGNGVSRETILFELLSSQEFSAYASDMGVVAITKAELPKVSINPSILMYLLQ